MDFVVWVSATTRDVKFANGFLGRATLALAMKYESNVCVVADLETLRARRLDDRAPPLRLQLAFYERLAEAVGAPVLDTTGRGVGESLRELLSIRGC